MTIRECISALRKISRWNGEETMKPEEEQDKGWVNFLRTYDSSIETWKLSLQHSTVLKKVPFVNLRKRVIQHRSGIKFFGLVRKSFALDHFINDKMLSKEEKEKLSQAVRLINEVTDRQEWNSNTLKLIEKYDRS